MERKEQLESILDNKVNYFSFKKHSLDETYKDDIKILSIIDKGKEVINELHGPLPDDKGRLPGDTHYNHGH